MIVISTPESRLSSSKIPKSSFKVIVGIFNSRRPRMNSSRMNGEIRLTKEYYMNTILDPVAEIRGIKYE